MSGYVFGDARLPRRFWNKVQEDPSGCWVWTGAKWPDGYGNFWSSEDRRLMGAHRAAFTALVGPIPSGLEIDHVKARGCENRACVNPDHLEPVTHAENVRRAMKSHCANGHPFEGENLAYTLDGRRRCLRCEWASYLRRKAKRQAASAARPKQIHWNSAKTHCPQGHPYDDANTIHRPEGGRRCRICALAAWARSKARARARRRDQTNTTIASINVESPWQWFRVAMSAPELGEVRDAINSALTVLEQS